MWRLVPHATHTHAHTKGALKGGAPRIGLSARGSAPPCGLRGRQPQPPPVRRLLCRDAHRPTTVPRSDPAERQRGLAPRAAAGGPTLDCAQDRPSFLRGIVRGMGYGPPGHSGRRGRRRGAPGPALRRCRPTRRPSSAPGRRTAPHRPSHNIGGTHRPEVTHRSGGGNFGGRRNNNTNYRCGVTHGVTVFQDSRKSGTLPPPQKKTKEYAHCSEARFQGA